MNSRAGQYLAILIAVLAVLLAATTKAAYAEDSRSFTMRYAGAITKLAPGAKARVWLPVAQSTMHQDVKRVHTDVPGEVQFSKDSRYQNELLYFEAIADERGEIPFRVDYEVRRRGVSFGKGAPAKGDLTIYSGANAYVPIQGVVNRLFSKPPRDSGVDLARAIYDQVDQHMRYDKPENGSWGRGDTLWACDSGFGNCTDFHSLYISLCRELGLAARFEIGFSIPQTKSGAIGGYHCWAATALQGRWLPVDISEADKRPEKREFYFGNLDADRVTFSVGRDIPLTPKSAAKTVNYLIYPHVEVEGRVHREFRKGFEFQDRQVK